MNQLPYQHYPAIPAAAPVIWNVAKSAYDSYQNKKANDKMAAERKRLNDAIIAGKVKLSPVCEMNADKTLGEGVKKRTRENQMEKYFI